MCCGCKLLQKPWTVRFEPNAPPGATHRMCAHTCGGKGVAPLLEVAMGQGGGGAGAGLGALPNCCAQAGRGAAVSPRGGGVGRCFLRHCK